MNKLSEIVKEKLQMMKKINHCETLIYKRYYAWDLTVSGGKLSLTCHNKGKEKLLSDENYEIMELIDSYFTEVKDTPDRFNKFIFELYADGTYKAEYLWDEEYILQQHLRTANIMPEWFFEKLTQRMEYWGYGDDWQTGQIVVWVKDNDVFCETYIIENGQKIVVTQDIVIEFENYEFKSDILSYYEMTNFGILKDVWQRGKWNKFIISCPEKDLKTGIRFLDLDKDVTYILEK